jgi:BirA family biotin operon repressor/biotin-[acetyl-CoA-carboxylase] ligase
VPDLSAAFRHPRIRSLHQTDLCESTQTWAKQESQASAGLPDGSLFLAREQTKGVGRQGRSWHSPRGGLWWSLLLKPALTPEKSHALSAAASLGLLEGIRQATGAPVRLKWPNDILLNGKKLAGILTETGLRGSSLEWVLIGAGINVNNPIPPELSSTATSLCLWKGGKLDFDLLLSSLLDGFFDVYDRFLKKGFQGIKSVYLGKLEDLGSIIKIEIRDEVYRGIARDVDPQGRLVVELDQRILRSFESFETHLV